MNIGTPIGRIQPILAEKIRAPSAQSVQSVFSLLMNIGTPIGRIQPILTEKICASSVQSVLSVFSLYALKAT